MADQALILITPTWQHHARPHYHANHYAAFVLDPDGHNIEAVCHAPA